MKRSKLPKIIWFTGLSGSGKTTLSKKLNKRLLSKKFKVKIVDGDKFRKKNKTKENFSKKNIKENNLSIIRYIDKIKSNFDFILVAVISPLLITRKIAKKIFKKQYYEIYVKCNLNILLKRDTKGLYKLAKKLRIKNLIGYKSKIKYEKSNYKKIVVDTGKLTINESLKKIYTKII